MSSRKNTAATTWDMRAYVWVLVILSPLRMESALPYGHRDRLETAIWYENYQQSAGVSSLAHDSPCRCWSLALHSGVHAMNSIAWPPISHPTVSSRSPFTCASTDLAPSRPRAWLFLELGHLRSPQKSLGQYLLSNIESKKKSSCVSTASDILSRYSDV